MRDKTCPINHCGRPQGIGTWATLSAGRDGSSDQILPVCEEHWQALRNVAPAPSTDTKEER